MIEVIERGFVPVAHIHDADRRTGEVFRGWFAADDRHRMQGEQDAAREKFILMCAAGVGENGGDEGHEMGFVN